MKLEACGNSLNNNIQVNNLLLTPKITINNQECINPLAYAQNMKDSFISQKEGFLLHGDLQQTNAILIEDDTGSSLRCIDNRGATIQDYLADLTKMLWGPTFVPIMEDMLQINCDISPENLILETKAKPGMSYAVDNLHLFGQHFSEAVHTSKACIDYLKDNPQANSQLLFTAGLQYLRDLGFVLPRLKAAMALDNPETALALSRRIMGDFAAAAIHMTEHKALYGNNDAEQKVDQQLNKKTP